MKEANVPASDVTTESGARCAFTPQTTAAKLTPSPAGSQTGRRISRPISFRPLTQARRVGDGRASRISTMAAGPQAIGRSARQTRPSSSGSGQTWTNGSCGSGAREPVGLRYRGGQALAQSRQQVGALHLRGQLRRRADAHILGIGRMIRAEGLRAPSGGRHGQRPLLSEPGQVGQEGRIAPHRAANPDQRPLRLCQPCGKGLDRVWTRRGHRRGPRLVHQTVRLEIEDVLRQHSGFEEDDVRLRSSRLASSSWKNTAPRRHGRCQSVTWF